MSQFDEDAHIEAVFSEIGHGTKTLADIGARLKGSNSANLIRKHGWSGVLVDRDKASADELRREFPACDVRNVTATPGNINALVPASARFLSIDVDGCDWWLWANLICRPALVVIETNPNAGLHVAAMGSESDYGCSVEAAKALGALKGYAYIGRTVVNAFFISVPCNYRLPELRGHCGVPSKTGENVF